MDPATPSPSTSRVINLPISPPKQRKRLDLGHLTVVEKQCMVNMYKQILDENPTAGTAAIIAKISKGAGCAKSTVYRVLKEYKTTGTVMSPPQHYGGRPSVLQTIDEEIKNDIRRLVHGFFFRSELPTLDKLINALSDRADLPQIYRSSLYQLLKQLNFKIEPLIINVNTESDANSSSDFDSE